MALSMYVESVDQKLNTVGYNTIITITRFSVKYAYGRFRKQTQEIFLYLTIKLFLLF